MYWHVPTALIVQCTHTDLGLSPDPADYCIHIAKERGHFDYTILAVPDIPTNDVFEPLAMQWGVRLFRGSEFNVARRLLDAARSVGVEVVVRVLLKRFYLDVELVHQMMDLLICEDADYINLPPDFNYELAADVLTTRALQATADGLQGDGFDAAVRQFSPWRFIEEHPERFKILTFENVPVYPKEKVVWIKQRLRELTMGENQTLYGEKFPASRCRFVAQFLDPDSRVLDIACGQGEGTAILGKYCQEVVGVDVSAEYVALARHRYATRHNIRFELGDAHTFLAGDVPFDAVVSMHTMEHLDNDRQFLHNVYRNLRPGGRFFLEVPLLMPRPLGEPLYPFHKREYLMPHLQRLVTDAGFAIQRLLGVNRGAYLDGTQAREAAQLHCVKL